MTNSLYCDFGFTCPTLHTHNCEAGEEGKTKGS